MMHNLYQEDPGGKAMTNEKASNTFKSLSNHPDRGTIMVIENNEEVIGYAILINFWSNEFGGNIVDIDEFYIKPEFRSQGIGSNFIKHLASTHFANATYLQLEVTPENSKARKLYESLGFERHKNDTYNLKLKQSG